MRKTLVATQLKFTREFEEALEERTLLKDWPYWVKGTGKV